MMGGRVIEANTDFYRYPICRLPSAGARQSNGNSRYPYRIRIAVNLEQK